MPEHARLQSRTVPAYRVCQLGSDRVMAASSFLISLSLSKVCVCTCELAFMRVGREERGEWGRPCVLRACILAQEDI